MTEVTVVFVGDKQKELIDAYLTKNFPDEYRPTTYDNYTIKPDLDNIPLTVHFSNTTGQEELENVRTMPYKSANVFILSFSLTDCETFEKAKTFWAPDVQNHVPKTPILVVGIGSDERDKLEKNQESKFVSKREGEEFARTIKAGSYIECSLENKESVDNVFIKAFKLGQGKHKKDKCEIF